MPALLQDAFRGVSPAVLSTWPGGVGALNVPIPLRGGGAPNMSGITPGLVANRIKMFSKQKNMLNRPNTTKRTATTQQASVQRTEPQGQENIYPNYATLMNNQATLRHVIGGYRSRKHRRRPTRKAQRKVQRKSRRLTRRR